MGSLAISILSINIYNSNNSLPTREKIKVIFTNRDYLLSEKWWRRS
jgi:hypothetical protein